MIEMTCHVDHFFSSLAMMIWNLESSCIYTPVYPAADVFPVVATTRTKSIQKQIKGTDVDKVGSKKTFGE